MRVGMEIVASTMIGLGIGYFLDMRFGTRPWFLLLFFLFGAGAGFLNLYHALRPDQPEIAEKESRTEQE